MSLNKIGLRINTDFQRVEKKWIERARKIQISNVGDVCFRLQGFHAGFNQYGKKKKFAGPALTVMVRPGDNLMLHKAIDIARPGDGIDLLRFRTFTILAHFHKTPQNIVLPVCSGWKFSIFVRRTFGFHNGHHFLQLHNTALAIRCSVRPDIFSPVVSAASNDFCDNIPFSIEPSPTKTKSFLWRCKYSGIDSRTSPEDAFGPVCNDCV